MLKYRPLILKQVAKYAALYYIPRKDLLPEAELLAEKAAAKYDPKRAKFGTLLISELRRLHRVGQREYRFRYGNSRAAPRTREANGRLWDDGWRGPHGAFMIERHEPGYQVRNYARWKRGHGPEKWMAMAESIARARPT